jgi:hypothetical protein
MAEPRTIQHLTNRLANLTEATVLSFCPELVDEETAQEIAQAVRQTVLTAKARERP